MVLDVSTFLVLQIPILTEHNVYVLIRLKNANLGSTTMELDAFIKKDHVLQVQHGTAQHVLQTLLVLKDFMATTTTVKLYLKNAFLRQCGEDTDV